MNDIEPGTYQVIIAAVEDTVTRTGYDMRRITAVTLDCEPPVVLYGFLVDAPFARWTWDETGAGAPDDIKVGMRFLAEIVRERTPEDGEYRMQIGRLQADPDVPLQFTEPLEESERPEPASRKSAAEQHRNLISETINEFLFDTADSQPVTEPRPYANARMGVMGVAMPDSGIEGGAILEPGYAVRLGAQLIRAGRMVEEFEEVILSREEEARRQ
jgi:hypothetical protein